MRIFKNISVLLELHVLSDLSKSLAEEWVGSKIRVFTSFPAASGKINIILSTEQADAYILYRNMTIFSLRIATLG